MSQSSYEYANRQGIRPISWEDFHAICRALALAAARYDPGIILGVARGGLYPGTLVAHLLQKEYYPIRLTRRYLDQPVRKQPKWLLRPPEVVRGERVLVIDEISGIGETLRMVKEELIGLHAAEVRSAVMYAHSPGVDAADYIGLVSDALLLNPWDREIVKNGQIVFNPEYVDALAHQHATPENVLAMAGMQEWKLAKGGA